MIKKQALNINKRTLLFLITFLINATALPNKIKDAVQEIHDEVDPKFWPMLDKQRDLMEKLTYAWYEAFVTDQDRENVRKSIRESSDVRQFLHEFYNIYPQALGIRSCKKCLKNIENPGVQDLEKCLVMWLKKDFHTDDLSRTVGNEKALGYEDCSLSSVHLAGKDAFEKRMRLIIEENSEKKQK